MSYLKPIRQLFVGSDDNLASSHLVRLDIFEIVTYNNHALKLKYAWNPIIQTSWRSTFSGGLTRAILEGTKYLWLKIWLDL